MVNYDNFVKAARLLVEEVGIAERRMTVSTAGIVPRIYDFGAEKIRPKLAISLNASNDELRTRLMPLNKKWNLEALSMAGGWRSSASASTRVDYVRIRFVGRVERRPENKKREWWSWLRGDALGEANFDCAESGAWN